MKLALGGTGAFSTKHLEGIANIDGVEVVSVFGRTADRTEAYAAEHGIPHWGTTIDDVLANDDVDAVILGTPTQMHAAQAIACMEAGKHVEVEIPLASGEGMVEVPAGEWTVGAAQSGREALSTRTVVPSSPAKL